MSAAEGMGEGWGRLINTDMLFTYLYKHIENDDKEKVFKQLKICWHNVRIFPVQLELEYYVYFGPRVYPMGSIVFILVRPLVC